MMAVRDATEKCIWLGHYMVAEGIKAFPKNGVLPVLSNSEQNRAGDWAQRQGKSCEREEKERNSHWSIFLGIKRVESNLELNTDHKFSIYSYVSLKYHGVLHTHISLYNLKWFN